MWIEHECEKCEETCLLDSNTYDDYDSLIVECPYCGHTTFGPNQELADEGDTSNV